MAKAIKVSNAIPETAQLEAFINTLGVRNKYDIYLYNDIAYINIDILLQLLSVSLKWFLSNADAKIHYINIKKQTYVNKYGLTKLLSQSKEAAAFKLQDYIFEVIYKLETQGSVHVNDIDTRQELIKTIAELNLYKDTDEHNRVFIDETKKAIDELRVEYAVASESLTKIQKDYNELLKSHMEQTILLQKTQDISCKLAQYVKLKLPNSTTTKLINAWSEVNEQELEENDNIENEILTRGKSKKNSKVVELFLMQSVDCIYSDGELYKWNIISILPEVDVGLIKYADFKEFSEDYRLGGISAGNHSEVWYLDLKINLAQEKLLRTVLKHISYMSESAIIDIIHYAVY